VTAGDRVGAIDIPAARDHLSDYPIATLADADQPAEARAWVRLVRSARGQRVLARDGFGKP
jgi:molybdate transport system substrate-binding protein